MRVVFDQGTPLPLRRHLHPHEVDSVAELGWSELRNGDLLDRAETNAMIRPATPEDQEFIAELAHAFDRFGPYVPVFTAMIHDNHATLTQHGVNGDVALFIHEASAEQRTGFVAVEWRQGVGHIHGVVVDDRFRRQGVATQLVDHVAQLAHQRGTQALECITAETENAPALRCFTGLRFQNEGYAGLYPQGQRAVRLCRALR